MNTALLMPGAVLLFVILLLWIVRRQRRFPYKAKTVMTQPEQILYFRLREALPEYVVLAQVQMSSFLAVTGTRDYASGNRIRQKSVDFLVCYKDTRVLCAIELQDRSHERPDRMRSDQFKKQALKAARIKLVEFHVRSLPTAPEIRARIDSLT